MSETTTEKPNLGAGPIHAPDTARRMAEPVTVEQADKNVRGFLEELYNLRVKWHIPDVLAIVRLCVIYESGDEGDQILSSHIGNTLYSEAMAAWALGYQRALTEERIATTMKKAGRKT